MSRVFDLLQAYQSAQRTGDTVTAHDALRDLLFAQNVPEEAWPDVLFDLSWAHQVGLAQGIEIARQAISAHRDTSASSPEARILRDLEDDG